MSRRKFYKKTTIVKRCEELGLTNVFVTYSKEEGWWLECDTYDGWLAMSSTGAMQAINNQFKKE